MYELSDIHNRLATSEWQAPFPWVESRINNTERPRRLAHPSDPALRRFLFRLEMQLQLLLAFTLPNLHCRKVHMNTRNIPAIHQWSAAFNGGHHLGDSILLTILVVSKLSHNGDIVPRDQSVENDTSKPL